MFTPTRAAAIESLNSFLVLVPRYAEFRNFARRGNRDVSRLSPYIRYRLISEMEVVREVLKCHSFEQAEKFIQEVVWRTYWKGWLERNPGVWVSCVDSEARYQTEYTTSPWGELYERACRGETKLDFFNEWVSELIQTGYLHNHVRMWFASVWVFTLKIPWQLGAMFMYRHLLDGDPASNTLSWRWVAGLQTAGKSYLAKPDNIARYSEERWVPKPGELAESTSKVELDPPSAYEWPQVTYSALPEGPYAVLTTSDDLSAEEIPELMQRAQALALLRSSTSSAHSPLVARFVSDAESDQFNRIGDKGEVFQSSEQVLKWLQRAGLTAAVVVAPGVGPHFTRVFEVASALKQQGIETYWYQREWDSELHKLADRGFFPFWERVRKRLARGEFLRMHGDRGR